jgi:hypothetical protein
MARPRPRRPAPNLTERVEQLQERCERLERCVRFLAGEFYTVSMNSDHYDLDWQALRALADGAPELALCKVPT